MYQPEGHTRPFADRREAESDRQQANEDRAEKER